MSIETHTIRGVSTYYTAKRLLLHKYALLLVLLSSCVSLDAAELRFAKIFTDHVVLQRDMPVPVWGWAEPNTAVSVTFAGRKKTTMADASAGGLSSTCSSTLSS